MKLLSDASFLGTLGRNRMAMAGLVALGLIVALALLAPLVAPFDPIDQRIARKLQPPSAEHLLGTDTFGRDVLSRILYGARVSLMVGLLSVAIAMVLGTLLGLYAGYKGGRIDTLIMRSMDVLLTFPTLVMGLLILAVAGASVTNIVLAIAVTLLPNFARVARAPTLSIARRDYVEACRSLGYSDARIMLVHVLPNILGDVFAMAALWTALAILIEASLSFIGLGVPPPAPTWGGMMRDGFERLIEAPWLSIYPGIAILVTVFAINLFGDGLRDALDPKLRSGR